MTYQEIIDKIKACMDELTPINGGLLVSLENEEIPVGQLIVNALDGAWRSFALSCPLHLLPYVFASDDEMNKSITNLVVVVDKPTNFIRLHSFTVSSWVRAVTKAHTSEEEIYAFQKNIYSRGTPTRPVVIEKNTTLEGYTAAIVYDTVSMSYIPAITFVEGDETTDYDEKWAYAFCYHVAGVVYDILGNEYAAIMYANRDKLCV